MSSLVRLADTQHQAAAYAEVLELLGVPPALKDGNFWGLDWACVLVSALGITRGIVRGNTRYLRSSHGFSALRVFEVVREDAELQNAVMAAWRMSGEDAVRALIITEIYNK